MAWGASASDAAMPAGDGRGSTVAGHWEGVIRNGPLRLGIRVDIEPRGDGWAGSAVVPAWGDRAWPLARFRVASDEVRFGFEPTAEGTGTFVGKPGGQEITGVYAWGGREFPFSLGRGLVDAANRPCNAQVPKPPLPYSERDVTFRNGPVTLAATITSPPGRVRHPGVVLLSGSEPRGRKLSVPGAPGEENIWSAVVADHLARAGVVCLHMDSRGRGGSTGSFDDASVSDLTDDAVAAVKFLRSQDDVAPGGVGLLGISEGGVVASAAAAQGDGIAFVVLVSALVIPLDQSYVEQNAKIRAAAAATTSPRDFASEKFRRAAEAEAARSVAEEGEADRELYGLVKGDLAPREVADRYLDYLARTGRTQPREKVEARVGRLTTPHFRSLFRLDPRTPLGRVRAPVLALYGERDLAVGFEANCRELDAALRRAGNSRFQIKHFPDLDHGLCRVVSQSHELPENRGDEVIDGRILSVMSEWISDQARTIGGRRNE